ncbi:MAG: AAA family ATPase [Campylobacterales bacterium]|nr:AAA family ATPase [Campylobacterales bacterium]
MKKDSSKDALDKNIKFMVLSSIILFVLFIYMMLKGDTRIVGASYYFGLFFLIVLLLAAIILRINKDKLKAYFDKKREKSFSTVMSTTKSSDTNNVKVETANIQAQTSNISFKDVAGIKNVKAELEEIVEFLNKPERYLKHGVKLPKGVLLVGPPGVGKTLMARAVAGEADVPFFYQSGASFVHIYVGMGAKKVRELFTAAKAKAPSVIFIDEIDAVGKKRVGGSNDERESTLNELLTQMDGFEGDSGVIVIAATNKIEILDDALLRAGRFDRRVHINLPNIEDRKDILDLYLKGKVNSLNINELASSTAGFSSASLATLINESLLNMIKRDDTNICKEDIEIAKTKLEFGKKENKILDEEQKEILAIYQASKAFIAKRKISLLDEGISKCEIAYPSKSQLIKLLKEYLAGSIGIDIIKHEQYVVSVKDLKDADELALKMTNDYKMAGSVDDLLNEVKISLRNELYKNIDKLNELKDIMIKNEVILESEID